MRISDWSSDVCSSDLVLLRRILGELDGAVGAPVEPLRVLLDPGMVGRALDREVEGDLQPVLGGRVDQPGEIVEVAELRMDGVVTTLLRADGVGAARVALRGFQGIVAALAVDPADRVDRRQVEHIEAEVAQVGEPPDDIVEGAVPCRVARLRARQELVPGAEGRLRPVRSEENTSELQSLMRTSYAAFCLKKKITNKTKTLYMHNRTA